MKETKKKKSLPHRGSDTETVNVDEEGRETVTKLVFVEEHADFSKYRRPDGTFAYLTHDEVMVPFTFEWDNNDVKSFWETIFAPTMHRYMTQEVRRATLSGPRDDFRTFLRETLTDPDEADELFWCVRCEDPTYCDDGNIVQGGDFVCDSCINDHGYEACDSCGLYDDDTSATVGGGSVCSVCRDANYTFCDHCDAYRHNQHEDEHAHEIESGECCASPAMEFTMRNDGNEPLANDVRTAITLPSSGEIDEVGIARIRNYLSYHMGYTMSDLVPEIGPKWQTKEGNWPKRLSRVAYAKHKVKVPTNVLSEIGNIAAAHSNSADFAIEITRDLNLSPGEFANSSSCWWNGYIAGRCALKTNGGFAIRTFSSARGYDQVSGRSWVMPLRLIGRGYNLRPTFDAMTPEALVTFNGYGDLEGYNAARILAHMTGWTYRKIGFICEPMYVNAGGYLIAPEELAQHYTDGSMRLKVEPHAHLYTTEQESENGHVA